MTRQQKAAKKMWDEIHAIQAERGCSVEEARAIRKEPRGYSIPALGYSIPAIVEKANDLITNLGLDDAVNLLHLVHTIKQ